jgi:hypothetical protein
MDNCLVSATERGVFLLFLLVFFYFLYFRDNSKGQLGVKTSEVNSDDLIKQQASAAMTSSVHHFHSPTLVDASFGSSLCIFIACGGKHSLGISYNSGELYTWGDGGSGQLGDGMDSLLKRRAGNDVPHFNTKPLLVNALNIGNRRVIQFHSVSFCFVLFRSVSFCFILRIVMDIVVGLIEVLFLVLSGFFCGDRWCFVREGKTTVRQC